MADNSTLVRSTCARRLRLALGLRPDLFRHGRGAIQDFADRYGLLRTGASRMFAGTSPVPPHVLLALSKDVNRPADWFLDADKPDIPDLSSTRRIPIFGRTGDELTFPERWAVMAQLPPMDELLVVECSVHSPGLMSPVPEMYLVHRMNFVGATRGAVLVAKTGSRQPILCDLYDLRLTGDFLVEAWDGSPPMTLPATQIVIESDPSSEGKFILLGRAVGVTALGATQLLAIGGRASAKKNAPEAPGGAPGPNLQSTAG